MRGKHKIFNPKGVQASCVIQYIAAYQLRRRDKTWENIQRRAKSHAGCEGWVKTDGVKLPVSWESLAQLERLNDVSLQVYTLYKNGGGIIFLCLGREAAGLLRSSPAIPGGKKYGSHKICGTFL